MVDISSFTVPFEISYKEYRNSKISKSFINKYISKKELNNIKNVFYIDVTGICWIYRADKDCNTIQNGTEIQLISIKEGKPEKYLENVALVDFNLLTWNFDDNLIKSYKPKTGESYVVIVPKYSSYIEIAWMAIDLSYFAGKQLVAECAGNNTYFIKCDVDTVDLVSKNKSTIENNYKVAINTVRNYKDKRRKSFYEW